MSSRAGLTIVDYDGDKQAFSFEGVTGTAGNFAAQATLRADLITALQAIILGNTLQTQYQAEVTDFVVAPPTEAFAQVNIQWIIEYADNVTGLKYTTRIGTANVDLTDTIYNGAPALSVETGGAGEDVKLALEAYGRHNGNAITVNAIYYRE